jgi:hypothetical protein
MVDMSGAPAHIQKQSVFENFTNQIANGLRTGAITADHLSNIAAVVPGLGFLGVIGGEFGAAGLRIASGLVEAAGKEVSGKHREAMGAIVGELGAAGVTALPLELTQFTGLNLENMASKSLRDMIGSGEHVAGTGGQPDLPAGGPQQAQGRQRAS